MGSREEFASFSSISDWEWESTNQEEIDAAFSLAESLSAKRHRSGARRLPDWQTSPSANPSISRSAAAAFGSPNPLSSTRRRRLRKGENSNSTHFCNDDDGSGSSCPRNGNPSLTPSPCRLNVKLRYPAMNFGGRIVYSRTYPEVEKATKELLEIIAAKKQNMDQISLGLDIEWRPTFRRGEAQNKAAVMQICASTDHCYVMHIIHSGIPPILQSLLEDTMSIKVGVGIANDALKIMKDYNVCIKDLGDLSNLANVKLSGVPKQWGLGSLAEMLTCKQLEKPNRIRLGNWEASVLSEKQLQYAATDAFASWYLYQVLRSFPDAAKTQSVEEKANGVQS